MASYFDREATELLKNSYSIVTYLQEKGFQPRRKGTRYICLCPDPKHNDMHLGSFSISGDGRTCKCWSCGFKGDIISVIRAVEGFTTYEALQFIAEKTGLAKTFEMEGKGEAVKKAVKKLESLHLLSAEQRELLEIETSPIYAHTHIVQDRPESFDYDIIDEGYLVKEIISQDPWFDLAKDDPENYARMVRKRCLMEIKKLYGIKNALLYSQGSKLSEHVASVIRDVNGTPTEFFNAVDDVINDVYAIYAEYGGDLYGERQILEAAI